MAKLCPHTGKRRYVTATAAGEAISRHTRRLDVSYQRMYLCPLCKGWHLTTQTQRRHTINEKGRN